MGKVKNHQPMGVFAGALQANTLSARVVGNVFILNADVDRPVVMADETRVGGSPSINVVHEAIGRVRSLYG